MLVSQFRKILSAGSLAKERMLKNNKVQSLGVSVRALKGTSITILANTHIDAASSIGSYTYIGRNCHVTRSQIGNYVSIANNVSIGPGEHDLSKHSTSSIFYDKPYDALTLNPCSIGHDVWIGVGAVILRGVELGIGAVVGANTVVTRSVLPYSIVVGCPAKHIRFRFPADVQKNIAASKWWLLDPPEAKILLASFENKLEVEQSGSDEGTI